MPQLQNSDSKTTNGKDCLRVLLVDDDVSILEVSKSILESEHNFEVDLAGSVDEAFNKLEKQSYDGVVCDYEMPQKDGLSFLRELREQKNFIPFALFTGKGREDVAIKALNLGADGYFHKQGNPETVYGELAHGVRLAVERFRAKSALEESEKRYRELFSSMNEMFSIIELIYDKDGKAVDFCYRDVNPAFEGFIGKTREYIIGKKAKEVFGIVEDYWFESFGKVAKTGNPSRFENYGAARDKFYAINAWKAAENLIAVVFTDITERKRQERESKRKSDEISSIVEGIGDLLFVIDKNRVITKVNKATCDTFKKKPEELIGRHCYEVVPGTEAPWCNCPATKTFETKQTVTEEINDPNIGMPLLVTTSPILNEKGEVTHCIHIAKDLTSIKLAEMEIHIAANLFDAATDSILVHEMEGKLVYFNEAAYKTRGYTRDEFQGLSIQDLETPDNPKFFGSQMRKLLDNGEATFEAVNMRKDKTVVPVEIHARVIESEGRKLVLSVARDVSERKKAEENLRISEERLKEAQAVAHIGNWEWDTQTGVLIWGEENYRIFGFPRETVPSVEKFLGAVHPDDAAFVKQSIEDALKGKPYDIDMRIIRTDGVERVVNATGKVECDVEGKPVRMLGMVHDITERKKAEEAVSASLARYRSFIEVTGELGWNTNAAGEVLEDIPSFRNFTGQTYDEVKGWGWTKAVHPDDLEHTTQVWQAVVAAKTKYEIEYRLRRFDGVYRNFMVHGVPIFEEDGKIREWVGTCIDITERKKAEEELNRMMDQLVLVNEKLGVVGSLTRHDVRNKLSVVTGHAYLLKKKYAGQADIVERLSKMEQAVADSVRIFEFSKMYEQLGIEELTYVDVEKAVDEAASLFSGLTIKVVNDCHGLSVLADSFLRQLFYNLIDNTRKYGKKATAIRVYFEKSESGDLHLIYEDDGVGISTQNKTKLFSEGFSTGGSTGFGLFLIKKMMDVYGWQIQETGDPGKGANFVITIPKLNKNGKENSNPMNGATLSNLRVCAKNFHSITSSLSLKKLY